MVTICSSVATTHGIAYAMWFDGNDAEMLALDLWQSAFRSDAFKLLSSRMLFLDLFDAVLRALVDGLSQ
jgi:hypothetical protein